MDEICILFLQGRATPAQHQELMRWRNASPLHEQRFRKIQMVWEMSDAVEEIDPAPPTVTPDEILGPPRRATTYQFGSWGRSVGWAAAAVAVLVGVGVAIGSSVRGAPAAVTEAEFRAGSGDLATAALGDGSVVRLGPDSRIQVKMFADRRQVRLHGRAFFAVTSDQARPFEVLSEQGDLLVLGTRFEADTRDGEWRVLVLEGRVEVAVGRNQLELHAGDLSRAGGGSVRSVERVKDPEALLDWLGGFLAFEATPLRQVAIELETQLGVRLEIADPALEARTITGWFADVDGHEVAGVICRIARLRCVTEGDVVRVLS